MVSKIKIFYNQAYEYKTGFNMPFGFGTTRFGVLALNMGVSIRDFASKYQIPKFGKRTPMDTVSNGV